MKLLSRAPSRKRLSSDSKKQVLRLILFLLVASIGGFIIVYSPRLPLYVLEARLKDIAAFETQLDSFEFTIDGQVKLNRFVVSQDGTILINEGESDWDKLSSTIRWNKQKNSFITPDESLSPDEVRATYFLFDRHVLLTALESKKYRMADIETPEGVVTEIYIPGEIIKDVLIKQYSDGYVAVSKRAGQESCFMGLVKNFTIDKVSASQISGDFVFTISHKSWDIVKIQEPNPRLITVDFHGTLCSTGSPVSGQHVFSSANDTIIVREILPVLPKGHSGITLIDWFIKVWKLNHYE